MGNSRKQNPWFNRRGYLGLIAGTGAAALAGCTGGQSEETTETGDTQGTSSGDGNGNSNTVENNGEGGDISRGGHLHYSFGGGPDEVNPLTGAGRAAYFLGTWMYSQLTRYDFEAAEVVPELATDWETNDTADEWIFHLNEDAVFSYSGEPVLAADVKASIETIVSEEKAPAAVNDVGPVESVKVIDDHTVKLILEHSFIDLPLTLSDRFTKILPKTVIENQWDAVSTTDFGSGPFVLDEFEVENFYEFSANDQYYPQGEDGDPVPYVDKLTMHVEPDPVSEYAALVDGRIDVVHELSATNFEQAEGNPDIDAVKGLGSRVLPICLTTTIEPFDDVRVRQAMKYAVNKKDMLAALQYGELKQDHLLAPFHKYYADLDSKFGFEPNLEKARELLAEAGYEDGFDLPTLYYIKEVHPVHESIAVLFQEQMAALNINFEISNIGASEWVSEYWNTEDSWYVSNWSLPLDIETQLRITAHSEGKWNEMKWSNAEFDEALDNASKATTVAEKQSELETVQRVLRDEGAWIVPFTVDRLTAKRKRVKNLKVGSGRKALIDDVYLAE